MPIPEFSFRSAEDRFRLLVNTLGKDSLRKNGIWDEWSQVLLPGFHREQRNMMRRFRDKHKSLGSSRRPMLFVVQKLFCLNPRR